MEAMEQKEATMIRESFENAVHFPTLRTLMLVEDVLKKSGQPLKRADIKRRMKMKIMHQTLNLILAYLLERGMIVNSNDGFVWIHNPDKIGRLLKRSVRVR